MDNAVKTQAEENFISYETLSLIKALPFLPCSHLYPSLSSDGGFTISWYITELLFTLALERAHNSQWRS